MNELAAQHETALPMRELSALALRRNGDGTELLTVGDEDFSVVITAHGVAGRTKREGLLLLNDGHVLVLPARLEPGGDATPDQLWTLAGTLPPGDPEPQPEGLVLVGACPLVAFDTKFAGDNLLRFDAI